MKTWKECFRESKKLMVIISQRNQVKPPVVTKRGEGGEADPQEVTGGLTSPLQTASEEAARGPRVFCALLPVYWKAQHERGTDLRSGMIFESGTQTGFSHREQAGGLCQPLF